MVNSSESQPMWRPEISTMISTQANLHDSLPNHIDSTLTFAHGWKITTTPTRFILIHPDGHEDCLAATKTDPEVLNFHNL